MQIEKIEKGDIKIRYRKIQKGRNKHVFTEWENIR